MKRIGWAIALAAATMTLSSAGLATTAAAPAAAPAAEAAGNTTAAPALPSIPADSEYGVPRPGALGRDVA